MAITRRHLFRAQPSPLSPRPWELQLFCRRSARAAAQTGAANQAGVTRCRCSARLKYPADFKRFDYVNPDAPKGGVARMISIGTFDNFNIAVTGVKGSIAPAANLIYETLLARSQDEVAAEYGLLAETAAHPDDFAWVIYRLRKDARWHDGKPVTPDDVIFSLEVLKKYSPMYASYYRHVVKVEKIGERDIKFTFDAPGNRELPTIVGELRFCRNIFGKAPTARAVSAISRRRHSSRRWARALSYQGFRCGPVRSSWNGSRIIGARTTRCSSARKFRRIAFRVFPRQLVALEAFKADQADWIAENSAKQWATAYDFPAVTEKRVVKEEFPVNDFGRMQAFALNVRRDQFEDARLRRAFNFAYDFEEMNKQLFFGQYKRINSYFAGTELARSGLPEGVGASDS